MQRRPTSFDIAALAGVSQPTVSRALRGSPVGQRGNPPRVLAAAEQLNYKVDKNASNLRRSSRGTLALLFFEDPTAGRFAASIHSSCRCSARSSAPAPSTGYDLLISFQQLSTRLARRL